MVICIGDFFASTHRDRRGVHTEEVL